MQDVMEKITKYTGLLKLSPAEVVTPMNIVKDMVELLPSEIFKPESTFLDPAVKSGRFLIELFNRLMESSAMIEAFPDTEERKKKILTEQLFGLATSETTAAIVRKALYNDPNETGNIIYSTNKFSKELIQGAFHIMQFDVVIGNPPYNKDIFLDFVDISYQLSSGYVVMITPAKWQTDADNARTASKITYKEFRDKYVKHMSHVVFYPACKDVFDIYQTDGITYYALDKHQHNSVIVDNKCKDILAFNSSETRHIANRETLINIGNDIINSIGSYKTFSFIDVLHGKRYRVYTNTQISGYDWFATERPRYALGISRIVDSTDRKAIISVPDLTRCTFEADTEDECKFFISWINSRFTRFFVAINMSKLTGVVSDDCFRFVPDPGPFDHIFTDDELYRKFGLRPAHEDYIKVIESVIRERK